MSLSSKIVMTGVVTLMLCACGPQQQKPTPTVNPDNRPMLEKAKDAVTPDTHPDVKDDTRAANETRNQVATMDAPGDANGVMGDGMTPPSEAPAEPTPFGAPDEAAPASTEPPSA